MEQEENQNQNFMGGSYTNNYGYNGDSILKTRLDTQQLISQIESFLKGRQVVYEQDAATQMIVEKYITIGEPLANDRGIHALLSLASASINAQTVQGNYEWETWREEVAWCREQLASDVFVNHDEWGISPQNISLICNTIMNMIKPFLTRLVNNEERKSYSSYQESRVLQAPQKKGLSSIFGW